MSLKELTVGEDLMYQEYPMKILVLQRKSLGITATTCAKCSGVITPKKKLLGKKKIRWRQRSHISFLIYLNLGGEIHPKGGMFVTHDFQKNLKLVKIIHFT
jgi:hypothetical protein